MEKQLKSLGSNLLSIHGGSSRVRGAARGADTVTRFTSGDVEAINRLTPYVRRADGIVNGSGQVVYKNQNWSTRIEGVGYNYGEMRAAMPETGRWFTPEEIKKLEKVVILGMSVLEQLFGDSDPMGKIIKINRINFRVIGIAPEKGLSGYRDRDDIIYIPVTTAMHRVLGKDYLDQIYVEVSDVNLMKTAQAEIERILRKRHRLYQNEDTFHMHDMTEIQDMLSTTTRTMSLLLGCIAAISLVVGGIGIMNIMLVSVTERTREIGLRKAIGARRIDIMMQFLIESVVMTLIGGLLGIMAGASVALLLSHFAGWTTRVTVYSVGLATVFSIMVGIFFGLWPARRAAQLKPVEALRYE
jgi:macrolide transport system ATP-binding/permease protein